jgi:hypothetical protein
LFLDIPLVNSAVMESRDFQISEALLLKLQIVDGSVCGDDACSAPTGVHHSGNQQ